MMDGSLSYNHTSHARAAQGGAAAWFAQWARIEPGYLLARASGGGPGYNKVISKRQKPQESKIPGVQGDSTDIVKLPIKADNLTIRVHQ